MTDANKKEPKLPDFEDLRCPGEPYAITRAVCAGRQKRHYEKCEGCPHKKPAELPSTVLTGRRK